MTKRCEVTLGDVVIYTLTEDDKNVLRSQNNIGAFCNIQDNLPAIVVAVWSKTTVNLKVIIDGHTPYMWKTSIIMGGDNFPGCWRPVTPELDEAK